MLIKDLWCECKVERVAWWVLFSIAIILFAASDSYGYRQQRSDDFGYNPANVAPNKAVIVGKASWYGQAAAGRKTATGERLDPNKLTAASTQLPLQSRALVTDLENGRSVGVRINDCGPYTKGRQIDISKRAAETLDMVHRGTASVKIQAVATPPSAVYCLSPKGRRRETHHHFHSPRSLNSR
jgi:rare lipoprotein A (peptidoglycan hydrolase)